MSYRNDIGEYRSEEYRDLEALRLALTRLYVNAGYINSGAVLPDQTVTEGVITFHILEGTLTSVTVEGNRWFREGYLRQRLTLDIRPPLNIGTLQERLQLLQQDDRIVRLDAELSPGVQLGESMLHVRVAERLPFFVALEFNNYQSPTIGAERGLIVSLESRIPLICNTRWVEYVQLMPFVDFGRGWDQKSQPRTQQYWSA